MGKIKKGYNLKIMIILLGICLLINSSAYSMHDFSNLRPSLRSNYLSEDAIALLQNFPVQFTTAKWRIGQKTALSMEEVYQAIKSLLYQKEFMTGVLQDVFGQDLAPDTIKNVNIGSLQEGAVDGEGIFKAEVKLKDGRVGAFVLVVPKLFEHSQAVRDIFYNLCTLYKLKPEYVVQPYRLGKGSYGKTGRRKLNIFATEYLSGCKEINVYDNLRLILNPFPRSVKMLNTSVSANIRREMVRILTIYYVLNDYNAIACEDLRMPDRFQIGAAIQAGDFVKTAKGLSLKLITARRFIRTDIPDFIDSLLKHVEMIDNINGMLVPFDMPAEVFSENEVYGGIEDALRELYPGQAEKIFQEWKSAYEKRYGTSALLPRSISSVVDRKHGLSPLRRILLESLSSLERFL